jgi:hypothetical protein
MIIMANAFSINMLNEETNLKFIPINEEQVKEIIKNEKLYSIIGHQGTVDLLNAKLGLSLKFNRENYKMNNDKMIISLPATRLEEGKVLSKEELEAIKINYWLIEK